MSRSIKFDYVTRYCVNVRGWGARDLIIAATGKYPVRSTITKSWVITEDSAADVIAICDQRGINVETTGEVPKVEWPVVVDHPDIEELDESGCSYTQDVLW